MLTIGFRTQNVGDVSLDIYDISGKLTRRLIDNALAPGNHRIAWNGKDGSGKQVSPGIYFYRFKQKHFQQRGKFVIL
jgi:flagellar hook assembly protein FlgD